MHRKLILGAFIVLFCCSGCAGWSRGCSSGATEKLNEDWIVVTLNQEGKP